MEFSECRADKVAGKKPHFRPYIMSDMQQARYLDFKDINIAEKEEQLSKQEHEDRLITMRQLDKLIEDFSLYNFRDDLLEVIDATKEDSENIAAKPN